MAGGGPSIFSLSRSFCSFCSFLAFFSAAFLAVFISFARSLAL
jgi:hypothetical protein